MITREIAKMCVGPGWGGLLDRLYDAIPPNAIVVQVKEKFGGLRFYVDAAPGWFFDLIHEAEDLSMKTCEECGEPGYPAGGWIKTLCEKHHEERNR